MKKRIKRNVILIVFSLVVLLSLYFIFISPRYLSDYMFVLSGGKVYTPKRCADSYMSSSVGHKGWKYDLNINEQKLVEEYIEEYYDVWHDLSEDIIFFIQSYMWESEKIKFDKISVSDAECCVIRARGVNSEFLKFWEKDEENYLTDQFAVFLYDKLNLTYYCIFLSNK